LSAAPADPITDFQRLTDSSIGEMLPIFGRDLFQSVPSTFAPGNDVAVAADYLIGPGDDILLRMWGPENFNGELTVDRSGAVFIPKVGPVHVAGLRFDELGQQIRTELSRSYRNFDISVNLGRLRSIQIFVIGEAKHPGAYTISSLSTILNALLASGGPNVRGSLRHVKVSRASQTIADFDLYGFILNGDKSKDIRLQTGDTIFIPPVGPQVALGGSVRHPAIYELSAGSKIQDLLDLAGGFSTTASPGQISLERIREDASRSTMSVSLDQAGRDTLLRDGDILYAGHITAGYEKTVSIRGNLANPGRFAWHPGMRLSDIIPDRMSLLTTGYWNDRNRLGVPVPLFEPSPLPQQPAGDLLSRNGETTNSGSTTSSPVSGTALDHPNNAVGHAETRNLITVPASEIDWSYAVIERLDPNNLKNMLIPFNLGKLVQDHDESQNLQLQPGDTVTVLSQHDVLVPQEQQTKYVRLEGEFAASGVYSVGPADTLADLVRRAGGLTPKAYLFGSSFTRESARLFQQQRLDEYVTTLSTDMEREAAARSIPTAVSSSNSNAMSGVQLLVNQLRQLRATGRVVLEFTPSSTGVEAVPKIPLEDGDVFRVPVMPETVSVVGAVYGQNVFLYDPNRRVADYVALAGSPTRVADRKRAFIIRADGSVFNRERAKGTFSNEFNEARINPGDSIVIPEKLVKPPLIRDFLDYAQIFASFGLTAASVNVLR
jgi:protein involved in polysaccharide export with SLBB domain